MKRQTKSLVVRVLAGVTVTGTLLAAADGHVTRAAEVQGGAVVTAPPNIGEVATSREAQLRAAGYVEGEFFLEGTAQSYSQHGEWTADGAWDAVPGETAPFAIRLLVRYPRDPTRFNGVVFVEWFNVSAQSEGDPNFSLLHAELLREGYAYVGVGAQAAGINGGAV